MARTSGSPSVFAVSLAVIAVLSGLAPPPAEARLGIGGGIGIGRVGSGVGGYRFGGGLGVGVPGYHPIYGDGVRPAVRFDDPARRFYDRPYGAVHPAWVEGGYWRARPWATGWYRVNPAAWGWWRTSAAAWGVAGLATAATITDLVDTAASAQSNLITIPQTSIQLNYASVEAVGEHGASFFYSIDGTAELHGGANCSLGLLDGQPPANVSEAQLLNAVCQVAYG
jgi:hypothetical protein